MAEKLERKVMEIYGENAATRDIIAYGSDIAGNIVETKDPDVIQTEAYKTGVRSAVVGNNSTTLQNRQALDFLFSRQLKYLYQHGIAEWGADETYFVNSLAVGSNGDLYVSLTDNNKGNDPVTDTTNWQAFPTPAELAQKVAKAGDTMTGPLKMSGENEVRFGTDDNYYYVQCAGNGQLSIFNKNNKGLFLQTEEGHAPFYWNGTQAYRLLTTGDAMNNLLRPPKFDAGVDIASIFANNQTYTPTVGGWIYAVSDWIGIDNQQYIPFWFTINGAGVSQYAWSARDGRDGQGQASAFFWVSKGQVVRQNEENGVKINSAYAVFYPGVNV